VDFLGDVDIESITVQDLRRYVVNLWDETTVYADHPTHKEKNHGLSPFTIAGRVRSFKRLFNWLEAEDVLANNPSKRIKTPKPKRKKPKGISVDDFRALLETTEAGDVIDLRDRAAMMFLYDTGCRAGGLCSMKIEDLDLEIQRATVTEKGGRARLVPFTMPTVKALQDWLEVRPKDRGPWVFVGLSSHANGAMNSNSLVQMLNRRAEEASCRGPVNPHSFRHAFARNYLMNEGDLASLSKILGNSIEIVVEYYAIFTIEDLQRKHKKHNPLLAALGLGDEEDE